jgi:Zn finger protein HypA/HybF involved in hydrogenase expression
MREKMTITPFEGWTLDQLRERVRLNALRNIATSSELRAEIAKREETPKIRVICLECGKKFQVRVYANECPKCGGSDIDVR